MTRNPRFRSGLLILMLLGAAAFTVGRLESSSDRTPADRPGGCLGIPSSDTRIRCLASLLGEKPDEATVRGLLVEVERMYRSGAIDDCHLPVHEIGDVVARRVSSVVRAMRMGNGACLNGYRHAVAQQVVAAMAHEHHRMADAARHVVAECDRLRSVELKDACVHGVGHGLMHDGDLAAALEGCATAVPGDSRQTRCRDGVMMENAMLSHHAGGGSPQRAARRCLRSRLPVAQQWTCFEQIGEIAMMTRSHELERAKLVCYGIRGVGNRAACMQGALREMVLWRTTRPASATST